MSRQGIPSAKQLAAGAEPPAFFPYLGMTVERVGEDEAVVRMDTPDGLMSPYGPVHGGAIAALVDTAIGVVIGGRLGEGERTATHQLNLNYISFADERRVIATARIVRLGRTAAHVEAEVRTASGKLVVKALATFAVLRRRESST
jgi:uncharacterized protein (TIGR00369 family)